jgi:hypothetical protein
MHGPRRHHLSGCRDGPDPLHVRRPFGLHTGTTARARAHVRSSGIRVGPTPCPLPSLPAHVTNPSPCSAPLCGSTRAWVRSTSTASHTSAGLTAGTGPRAASQARTSSIACRATSASQVSAQPHEAVQPSAALRLFAPAVSACRCFKSAWAPAPRRPERHHGPSRLAPRKSARVTPLPLATACLLHAVCQRSAGPSGARSSASHLLRAGRHFLPRPNRDPDPAQQRHHLNLQQHRLGDHRPVRHAHFTLFLGGAAAL